MSERLPSDKDVMALFRRLRVTGDPRLRNRLIEMHEPFVRVLARKFAHRGEPLDDLISQGNIALILAVDRFDPERGTQFATYATSYIVGEIRRYFRDKGWVMKVPRRYQELHLQVGRAVEVLEQRLGRSPRVPEIATEVGVSEEEILTVMEMGHAYEPASLDRDLPYEEEDLQVCLGENIGTMDRSLENYEERVVIREAISRLEPREQQIIQLRYFEELSQTEIAEQMGMSQMHVSRLLRRALAQLKKLLSEG
jgi:RNA polymerase sigma-B factor